MSTPTHAKLAASAQNLLAAHAGEQPLLLPNAWDVASAVAVAEAGFTAVATSSRAVAQAFGEPDDDSSNPDAIFPLLARVSAGVQVPVSADLQAGFGLPAGELVERMLNAGLVGCNLEDSEHHGAGVLVDADRQATFIAAVRTAAQSHGVHIVINARSDAFIHPLGDEAVCVSETLRRAALYLDADADCVYPIGVARRADAVALVEGIDGPVNLMAHRGGLTIAELTASGARRISLASGIFSLLRERHQQMLAALAGGADLDAL